MCVALCIREARALPPSGPGVTVLGAVHHARWKNSGLRREILATELST